MADLDRSFHQALHPLHAVLLAGTVPLFLGVLISDLAYAMSYELQWKNFASWLIVGGLVFCGLALLCALVALRHAHKKTVRTTFSLFLLLLVWGLGFGNALVHAKDAWASMPTALVISTIVAALTIAVTALNFTAYRAGEDR